MLKEFVEKISSLSGLQLETVEGLSWASRKPELVQTPRVEELKLSSLSSLIENGANAEDEFFHVESPTRVSVKKHKVDKWGRQVSICSADISSMKTSLEDGRKYSMEDFVLNLQKSFYPSAELDVLLDLSSSVNIKEESDLVDNGISQTVSTKGGAHLMRQVEVKNPMNLKPYATFPEIDVLPRSYIFRVHRAGQCVQFSLSKCDSVQWDIHIADLIKQYIKTKAPKSLVL